MPNVKLILLQEILAQKDVLFTRQMGAVAVKRKDGWDRISEMAYRHGYTKTFRQGKDFRCNNYRVWEDAFLVSDLLFVCDLIDLRYLFCHF